MPGEDWLYKARPAVPVAKSVTQVYFRDINCDYTIDGKDLVIDNVEAAKNQIRNILSTPLGSEVFEPLYGSNLPFRLFEPISPITAFMLETDTILALSRWLRGRIRVSSGVRIDPLEKEDGYLIVIPFVELVTNTPVVYGFDALR